MGLNNQNISGADELLAKIKAAENYLQKNVGDVVGTEAVKHFKQSFQNEGFTDTSLQKWATRKTKSRLSKKILTGQGSGDHLGDSIDYKVQGKTVIVYTDKVYAQIHNEGGKIMVTPKMKKYFWAMHKQAKDAGYTDEAEQYKYMALAKEITIVQRQYIGNSTVMNNKIIDKINRDLTKIFT